MAKIHLSNWLKWPRVLTLALLEWPLNTNTESLSLNVCLAGTMNSSLRLCPLLDFSESSHNHNHIQYLKGPLSSLEILRVKAIRIQKDLSLWKGLFHLHIGVLYKRLSPCWEEPFQVLLIIHSVLRVNKNSDRFMPPMWSQHHGLNCGSHKGCETWVFKSNWYQYWTWMKTSSPERILLFS